MDLYGVGATLATALGRRPVGGRGAALRLLINDLTRPDPADRPRLDQALARSAALAGRRPFWPRWLDVPQWP